MKNNKNLFCERLKNLMFEKNLTQEDLAKSIGTNQQMISRWMTGGRKPSLTSAEKIAKAMKVPLNYFFEIPDNKDIKILQLEKENLELKNKILKMEKEILNLKK